MAANTASTNAKNAKKDEFYTMKRDMLPSRRMPRLVSV